MTSRLRSGIEAHYSHSFTGRTKNQYLGLCPAPRKGCPLSRAEVGSSVQPKQDCEQTATDQFRGRQGERTGPRLLPEARDVPPAHPELPLDKETSFPVYGMLGKVPKVHSWKCNSPQEEKSPKERASLRVKASVSHFLSTPREMAKNKMMRTVLGHLMPWKLGHMKT